MRKRCKRRIRPTEPPLSDQQYTNLFTLPMMHLTAIISGVGEREHALSVAGLLNLGAALAYLRNNGVLLKQIDAAMDIMLDVLRSGATLRVMTETEQVVVQLTAVEITNYMRLVSRSTLVEAMQYVEDALDERKTVTGQSIDAPLEPIQGEGNVQSRAA